MKKTHRIKNLRILVGGKARCDHSHAATGAYVEETGPIIKLGKADTLKIEGLQSKAKPAGVYYRGKLQYVIHRLSKSAGEHVTLRGLKADVTFGPPPPEPEPPEPELPE